MLVGGREDAQLAEVIVDVIVIGGGQAGLAAGYFLRRTKLNFLILDAAQQPGGAWQYGWDSLRLFSPARWSSLPGRLMEGGPDYYPHRDEVIKYLSEYEKHYKLPVKRSVHVSNIQAEAEYLRIHTNQGQFLAKYVISATGSWGQPKIPQIPGREQFKGRQLHSAHYRRAAEFAGQKVAVVGGGNSGAQILAELSNIADCRWITERPPRFLPDELDGRAIFDIASAKYRAQNEGSKPRVSPASLGDVVVVAPVAEARERGAFDHPLPPPDAITPGGMQWDDQAGRPLHLEFDVIIWCTGFRADLQHLSGLELELKSENQRHQTPGSNQPQRIPVRDNQSLAEPRLFLLGYGSWTGYASATLVGIGRTARSVVAQIAERSKAEQKAAQNSLENISDASAE